MLLVKLADRLHNMRTLEHIKPEKRKRIARETLDIYAPLAGRMGMQELREELEELSFRQLNPDAYAALTEKLAELRGARSGLVEEIARLLEHKLAEVGSRPRCTGREKKPYSIWRKMENKQIGLEQLSDIYALPRHRRRRSTTATACSASSTDLADGARAASRTTSRRRSGTTTVAPHHGRRPAP